MPIRDLANTFRRSREWVPALGLILAIALCYTATGFAGFVWDDANSIAAGPTLKAIWATGAWTFCPLVLVTFWVEHLAWGAWPLPYHLVNVALHAANTVLLWRVLKELRVPGAWLGAVLWGLHPVQVESVAWISEMKNTLSGSFYLAAIFFFARSLTSNVPAGASAVKWNKVLVLVFAALAMASKPSTVVLPAVLGLLACWMEGRWHWRHARLLAPIFLMSVAVSVMTINPFAPAAAPLPQGMQSWAEKIIIAGDAIGFYLGKLLWPYPLMAVYPRWTVHPDRFISYQYLLTVVVLFVFLWVARSSSWRPVLFAFAYFVIALLPILGLFGFTYSRYSFVADHFQYLASMGPLALAGAGVVRLSRQVFPNLTAARFVTCAAIPVVCAGLSWLRVWVFIDSQALWTDTLAKNPQCAVAHNNLGDAVLGSGRINYAMEQFRKALAIDPSYAEAHNNLGIAFAHAGRYADAITEYNKTLALDSNFAPACNNLSVAFAHTGEIDEAVKAAQRAIFLNPNDEAAHYNLANLLLKKGQASDAIAQYRKALEIDPDDFRARHNLEVAGSSTTASAGLP